MSKSTIYVVIFTLLGVFHTVVLLKKGFSPLDWRWGKRKWEFGEKQPGLLETGQREKTKQVRQSSVHSVSAVISTDLLQHSASKFPSVTGRDSPSLVLLCQI